MSDNKEFVEAFKNRIIRFSISIIRLCDSLPKTTSAQVIARQLIRCATSIGANFVEAQAAPSRKDFLNFLSIALKSANETNYWLILLSEAKLGNYLSVTDSKSESMELAKILGSIISKLKKQQ